MKTTGGTVVEHDLRGGTLPAITIRPIAARSDARRRARRGQTLVEFALVFPIFITMLFGLIEFGFVFNAVLAVNYAARDGALAAAEAGDAAGADCVILDWVDQARRGPRESGSHPVDRDLPGEAGRDPLARHLQDRVSAWAGSFLSAA